MQQVNDIQLRLASQKLHRVLTKARCPSCYGARVLIADQAMLEATLSPPRRRYLRLAPLAPGTMLPWLAAVVYWALSTLTRIALITKAYATDQIARSSTIHARTVSIPPSATRKL